MTNYNGEVVDSSSKAVLLYDGVCGLCNHLVHFVLQRDSRDRFRFASLQSDQARTILTRHGIVPGLLDTMYVVLNYGDPGERLLGRSAAIIFILRQLGGFWGIFAFFMRLAPRGIQELAYRFIARYRYRLFGKRDFCPLPEPRYQGKFLSQ